MHRIVHRMNSISMFDGAFLWSFFFSMDKYNVFQSDKK